MDDGRMKKVRAIREKGGWRQKYERDEGVTGGKSANANMKTVCTVVTCGAQDVCDHDYDE
jgi:hypothetical protein